MKPSLQGNVKSPKKLVEEAKYSGELCLRNRKIRNLTTYVADTDLCDVTIVDCSLNLLLEVPFELSEWYCVQSLDISHNLIKSVPDFLTALCLLHVLDLSNNAITHLPSCISELKTLTALHLQNNKIVSLPNVIGKLEKCQMLDVSGNLINTLPSDLGNMSSLKHLDVSRNSIYSLPDEISFLDLVYLDASSNKISIIPTCYGDIKSLKTILLENNPLTSPPLSVLQKGRVHMFKSMHNESLKSRRQQEIMEPLLARKRERIMSKTKMYSLSEVMESMYDENVNKHNFSNINSGVITASNAPVSDNHAHLYTEKNVEGCDDVSTKEMPPTVNGACTEADGKGDVKQTNHVTNGEYSPTVSVRKTQRTKSDASIKSKREHPITLNRESSLKSSREYSAKLKREAANKPRRTGSLKSPGSVTQRPVIQKSSTNANFKSKSTAYPGYAPAPAIKQKPKKKLTHHAQNTSPTSQTGTIRPRSASLNQKKQSDPESDPSFTIRRKTEKIYEEIELMEQLRTSLESALKMPLPQDLLPALTDGVVLCHLANHVKSRSISTIHVPSPAVPTLSLAKSRRNVDNFLDACSKLGIANSRLCSYSDIMHGKGLSRILSTVNELLKIANRNSSSNTPKSVSSYSTPSVRIAPTKQKCHLYKKKT